MVLYDINFAGTSTASSCPKNTSNTSNTCVYSTQYTLDSDAYYGTEMVYINCTQALSNITIVITVQKTVNATFAKQYNTFPPDTVNQTHEETSSQIFYEWFINNGQTIVTSGFPYYAEAQFQLQGVNQTVSNDTYSVTIQGACNRQFFTQTGHF